MKMPQRSYFRSSTGETLLQGYGLGSQACRRIADEWRYILGILVVALGLVFTSRAPVVLGDHDGESAARASHSAQVAPSQQGPPGSRFTIRASGFRSFDPVESIKLGGVDVLGNRTIYTDAAGGFIAEDLLVPGLDLGIYALVITVGSGRHETTVASIFEVTGQQLGSSNVSLAVGLAPLLEADNLVRVFSFSNRTKEWLFFDPRTAFALTNTLEELRGGEIYWIKVKRDQDLTLNGKETGVSCNNIGTPSENCWTLVVW
jgi:hypothetical protein